MVHLSNYLPCRQACVYIKYVCVRVCVKFQLFCRWNLNYRTKPNSRQQPLNNSNPKGFATKTFWFRLKQREKNFSVI